MDHKKLVSISKYLSLHLRHQPELLGLELEPGGWVNVEALLAACVRDGAPLTLADLTEVVRGNDKQRFAFDESGLRIRANQGHSVEVDLQLEPREPPAVLLHGTALHILPEIREKGLLKMDRHYVHLTESAETALTSGRRKGKPIVVEVDATGLHAAGRLFYLTANSVWLVEDVPPAYLKVRDK